MGNTVPAQDDGVDIIDMTHLADPVAREPVDWMEVVALKSRCAPPPKLIDKNQKFSACI